MPDYAMCPNDACPSAARCYRSPKSGTQPSEFRQSWANFQPDQNGKYCLNFIPAAPSAPQNTTDNGTWQRDNGGFHA